MATASIQQQQQQQHSAGSPDSGLDLEDYSLYSNLSDEELLHLAIERSLIDHQGSPPASSSLSPPATNYTSHNPPPPNYSSYNPPPPNNSSHDQPPLNYSSHNPPPPNDSSHNPPAPNYSSHNPPAPNYNSHNPPPSTRHSTHNPPSEEPPDLKNFDGTVSHFLTGYGKRMVAYRRADGHLVHLAPEPEEEEEPLFKAIRTGDVHRVRALVAAPGTNLMLPNKPGWLALHQAAWYGEEACLQLLLKAQPGSLNKRTEKDKTALLIAVSREHVGCVTMLLVEGADTNIISKDKETALYKACERNNAEMVAMLLNHGAATNTHCIQGWTALQEAVCRNNVEICEMLVKAGAKLSPANMYGITPLFTAAQSGKVDTMRFLLKHGADINSQAADGASALYEAAKNGHGDVVEFLLSQKANANKPGRTGLLPLHVAAEQGFHTMVTMLLPATTKVRVQRTGISPLHLAAEHNRDDVLELLIQAGYDVNAQLSDERSKLYQDRRSTALYFAVINNNQDAVEMLLNAGADPNLDLFNPLLVALRQGCIETVTLLVDHGANVNACIPTHPTAFPAAAMFCMKYLTMFKYILDHGCDAQSCFSCVYGSATHPPIKTTRSDREELEPERNLSETTPRSAVQFCEMISTPSISRWAGPIIDVLLDYVGHVTLCSRLQEHLDSYQDWHCIKDKAAPPRPLMQLCRLRIRHLLGLKRLGRLQTLPLPGTLIRFLQYEESTTDI